MVTQNGRTEPGGPRDPLGVPANQTQEALQTDSYKELINKLAWALGSTYRTQYNNTRTPTRQLAARLARAVLISEGYPGKIAVRATT